ncbi:MAG: hypothetical protein F6K28_24070 [Microcoleus sp. SIO2G3]|nr:hypothetical protein [Microcoleus sp. SIO2G3]
MRLFGVSPIFTLTARLPLSMANSRSPPPPQFILTQQQGSDRRIVGAFVNPKWLRVLAWTVATIIGSLNA